MTVWAGVGRFTYMNLVDANRLTYSLVAKHLPGMGWRIDWNNSAVNAGQCKHTIRTLVFSTRITREVDVEEFTDTVLHEIAHALTPGHGHDAVWVAKHRSLGGTGSRTWSDPDVSAAVSKHRIECKSLTCDFKTYRQRITKAVRERGQCPRCRSGLNIITQR